jgi:hypothetical protein
MTSRQEEASNMSMFGPLWIAYTRAFKDAMILIEKNGDSKEILAALGRARDAIDAVIDDLPREGAHPNSDMNRRIGHIATSLRGNLDDLGAPSRRPQRQ